MHVPIWVRSAVLTVAALAVLTSAACATSVTSAPFAPSAPSVAAGVSVAPVGPSGGEALASGDPCALVTAAEVNGTLSQTVTDTQRPEAWSDEVSITRECALATDGKPLSGAGFDALSTLVSGFTGEPLTNPSSAMVGVRVTTRSQPFDAANGDTDKLPLGSKVIDKLGTFAVVVGVSGGGGLAFAQTSPTKTVVLYDVADRKVSVAQMEALLRLVVPRM
jgi:hypothetical protein